MFYEHTHAVYKCKVSDGGYVLIIYFACVRTVLKLGNIFLFIFIKGGVGMKQCLRVLGVLSLFICAAQISAVTDRRGQYQDALVNGKVIKEGVRGCPKRYHAIKKALGNRTGPFTMLDIGAAQGYFSFRVAHEYSDAVCVMIEGGYAHAWDVSPQLLSLCKKNTMLSNIAMLNTQVTADDLEQLAQREHFDVVLALNILHYFRGDWQRAADAVLALGDTVIIETPVVVPSSRSVVGCLYTYLCSKGTVILEPPREHISNTAKGCMLLFENKKQKRTVDGNNRVQQGIKLSTFTEFNGVYPTQKMLDPLLKQLYTIHSDLLALDDLFVQGPQELAVVLPA